LKSIFDDIIRDEALHHQAGVALFDPDKLSHSKTNDMLDSMAYFLEMIRVGPQSVINTIDSISGGLSRSEKIALIQELSGPADAAKKLSEIKQLVMIPGCEKILEYLEAKKLFEAYPAEHCA